MRRCLRVGIGKSVAVLVLIKGFRRNASVDNLAEETTHNGSSLQDGRDERCSSRDSSFAKRTTRANQRSFSFQHLITCLRCRKKLLDERENKHARAESRTAERQSRRSSYQSSQRRSCARIPGHHRLHRLQQRAEGRAMDENSG